MQARPYNFSVNSYNSSQIVEVEKLCNAITITNIGDTAVTVKGIPLYPGTPGSILGDSISIGGNELEILIDKRLPVAFAIPAGANPLVQIIQKYYVI